MIPSSEYGMTRNAVRVGFDSSDEDPWGHPWHRLPGGCSWKPPGAIESSGSQAQTPGSLFGEGISLQTLLDIAGLADVPRFPILTCNVVSVIGCSISVKAYIATWNEHRGCEKCPNFRNIQIIIILKKTNSPSAEWNTIFISSVRSGSGSGIGPFPQVGISTGESRGKQLWETGYRGSGGPQVPAALSEGQQRAPFCLQDPLLFLPHSVLKHFFVRLHAKPQFGSVLLPQSGAGPDSPFAGMFSRISEGDPTLLNCLSKGSVPFSVMEMLLRLQPPKCKFGSLL